MKNTSTLRIIAFAIVLFASVRVDANDPKSSNVLQSGNSFVNFEVKNHANLNVRGTIMNAKLDWGKWQVNGVDVNSVNNMEFDDKQPALFKAMGRDFTPSGAEGNFDIFISGKMVVSVYFDIPFVGTNKFTITRKSQEYMCDESGFTGSGSPTITITCYKLA